MMDGLSESDGPRSAAKPLNRWGVGTLSLLQVAFLTLVVIAANYIISQNYQRFDLSRRMDFTLSSSSKNYLASDALRGRAKPVKWILIYRRTAPFYDRVRALADEYRRCSKGGIELEVVDPLRSPDRLQEILAAYGISFVRDMLVIDARADDKPAVIEGEGQFRNLNPNVKLVTADDIAVFATKDGKRMIAGFQGEDAMTARLVEALEGKPKRMAILADKGRLDDGGESSPRRALEDVLRFQNISLEDVRLAGLQELPEDLSGVVIAAPKYDFTDSELAVLERYWNKPRAAILVLVENGVAPPKLRAFLRGHGITARQDRLVSKAENRLNTVMSGTLTQGVPFLKELGGQTTEFGGASSSLEVREGADDLLKRGIQPMGLILASPEFWGETRFGKGDEAYDAAEDHAAPLFVAASVTRGSESDDRFADGSGRMAVISNTDFLQQRYHRAENMDFFASTVNWLVGREALSGLGPRSLDTYKLPILDAQVTFINRVNLFFLPAFFLIVGAFVWSVRRV